MAQCKCQSTVELVVAKLFAFEVCFGAPHHYAQPVIDDYDKDLAVLSLRAADFAHAVPGVALAVEEQAMIAQVFASDNSFECFEIGRGFMVEASAVVQDQGFAAPRRVPILGRVEIEDVGAEFSFGVAVGRDGTTLRRVMPVKVELDSASTEQAPQEPGVTLAPKFGGELSPARLQVELITVLKNIAVVRPLAMRTLDAEHRLEQRDIGQ